MRLHPIQTHLSFSCIFHGAVTYKDGELERINLPEGYITPNGTFNAYYHDYQGNVRAVGTGGEYGTPLQLTHYYPYGLPFAEGIGASVNRYKYTGKELITEDNLNFYDFEARLQWPDIPVFNRPDPMEEEYTWLSPYNFCAANPVKYTDPTGKIVTFSISKMEDIERIMSYLQALGGDEYSYTLTMDDSGKSAILDSKHTNNNFEINDGKQMFNSIVNNAIKDDRNVNISVSNSDPNVLIGSYATGTIDLDDIDKIGEGEGPTSISAFGHEIIEQIQKQLYGRKSDLAHGYACQFEKNYTGKYIDPKRPTVDNEYIEIPFKDNKDSRHQYIIRYDIKNMNITNSTRPKAERKK